MPSHASTLCFTCGLSLSEPLRLNLLPGGKPCPACHDRLLDSLPPLLPSERTRVASLDPARVTEKEHLEGAQDWPTSPGDERL